MQRILDTCLLTDEEMEMGERAWQKNWCVDRYNYKLDLQSIGSSPDLQR